MMDASTAAAVDRSGSDILFKDDGLWFKDAVIYQLHVRSFYDSNDDGIGDFAGLTQKLDYIQDLGVTAIWVLPFFPSPLRDDGYDIADYTGVNPAYGSLKDFKAFLRAAHARDLRVITELVMNHTSDQHEWFQRSRRAAPGSKWRNFYVWADDPSKYAETRVIFQDFESSNWTWDPVAKAYYWHRFYHHQPDLNFDNPDVQKAMTRIIDQWLATGVDGLRLDAVPYLFEREGTNCENLPETHAFLKKLRKHVDEKFDNRIFLAEANQWPEDAAAYFGDGDECHMNFHFPLMPRLFMAVEREDRFPVIDILDQTPVLPENCQWAIFLRNHDELTLEMVTDEERDYMYRTYADESQARVNLGIRRRLAPLLRNNRRKIELMHGLLLSLPGTPIIYYGDEIGMGDNIYLGDRDGVRTPMQWNSDRNGGFSKANPQKLFLPSIIDAEYHFASRNVEVDQNSPHSMLWWMRRIISLRKQFAAFGRGGIEFLSPENPKILAFLREYGDETILVVANLSRFAQCAELNLAKYRGWTPVELFGLSRFPPIGELPYFLTLGPHSFYWFKLENGRDADQGPAEDLPTTRIRGGWNKLFEGRARSRLEGAIPAYLKRQRWFAGKARTIREVQLISTFPVPVDLEDRDFYLLLARVNYVEGESDTYLLPVVLADDLMAGDITGDHPGTAILRVQAPDQKESRTLCEATWEREFWWQLLSFIARRRKLRGSRGEIRTVQTRTFRELWKEIDAADSITVHGGQQSNTSVLFGNRLILKLFRRLTEGMNPDLEIGRFLTEEVSFPHVPDVVGALELESKGEEPSTLSIVHEYLENEGDAWVTTLDELGRYYERVSSQEPHEGPSPELLPTDPLLDLVDKDLPDRARELIDPYLQLAALLGKRTAEMHLALSASSKSGFAPEPFSKLYQRSLYQSIRTQVRRSLVLLDRQKEGLQGRSLELAGEVLKRQEEILSNLDLILDVRISAQRMRIHGDYHLGQVLFTGKDFVIIDFEGEPERTIGERRIKVSPLRDVAGMLRSYHYASHAALQGMVPGVVTGPDSRQTWEEWMKCWYVWTAHEYLEHYLETASSGSFLPEDREELRILLNSHLLEKALYELSYELNNRPDWLQIPLEGILQLNRGKA